MMRNSMKNLINSRTPKIQVKTVKNLSGTGYHGIKQITVEFGCRADLSITTFKEFFELFIYSVVNSE